MDFIKDGKGRGYLGGVDSDNRQLVYSTNESEISHASEKNGDAYVLVAECTPGTSATGVCSIVNDSSTKNLIIDKIVLVSEENTSVTAMTNFGFWRNSTTNSGGVAATPANLNFNSNDTADATCLEDADGTTLTISGGSSVGTLRLMGSTSQTYDFFGAIVLGTNSTFAIKSKTDNAGIKVRALVYFYFHKEV